MPRKTWPNQHRSTGIHLPALGYGRGSVVWRDCPTPTTFSLYRHTRTVHTHTRHRSGTHLPLSSPWLGGRGQPQWPCQPHSHPRAHAESCMCPVLDGWFHLLKARTRGANGAKQKYRGQKRGYGLWMGPVAPVIQTHKT